MSPVNSHALSRLRVGLGTFIAVDAESDTREAVEGAVAAAFAAIHAVENLMHPTRAGSDLAKLSACPRGQCVAIHGWTWEVLAFCRGLSEISGGVFDPCVPASEGRIGDIELLAGSRARLKSKVSLDLGGVAKGFAIDRAIEALQSAGCSSGLVNAGGDLAAFGPSRRVVCRESALDGREIELCDAALATSEVGDPLRPPEHRGHYHGITGVYARQGRVTVTAKRAIVADALTKCLLWCDGASSRELLARFQARQLMR